MVTTVLSGERVAITVIVGQQTHGTGAASEVFSQEQATGGGNDGRLHIPTVDSVNPGALA